MAKRPTGKTPDSKRSRFTDRGEVTLPKLKTGAAKVAGPTVGKNRGDSIANTLDNWANRAASSYRARNSVNQIIKSLCQEEGIFSSAAQSAVSIASTAGFKVAGFDGNGRMSMEVMAAAWSVIDMIDTFHDYTQGYNDKPSFNTLVAQLILDTVTAGGCGGELVLGDNYMPQRISPLSYATVEWIADGKGGRYPSQEDNDANLNLPTIAIAEHNRFPDEAYSYSMLRPGLSNSFAFTEYLEDLRRAVNRAGHSRLIATISYDKALATVPEEDREDPAKLAQAMNSIYNEVEAGLQGLEPEDAIIGFDTVDFDIKSVDNGKRDYGALLSVLGNLTGSSLKTPASVTGLRAEGGQGLSNAETLVYLKVMAGVPMPACEVLSRLITLAVRLWGVDGYVKLSPKPINLRPQDELEAWSATRQKRVMQMLSDGLITDASACYELDMRPEDWDYTLSGTGFYNSKSSDSGSAERESSSGRALSPGTPSQSGGDDQ